MAPAGGIERVVSTIINKISKSYDCSILTFDDLPYFYHVNDKIMKSSLNVDSVLDMKSRARRIIQVSKLILLAVIRLRKHFKNNNYDYVYTTHPLNHCILLLAGINHKKIVIGEHGANNNYNLIYRLLKRVTYKYCHAYCLPTRSDYLFYREKGLPVKYTPHYKPELPYEMHKQNSKTILCVGRLTADKQHLLLLKMWKNIINEIPFGWTLHIVGDGELKPILKDFINKNGLSQSVRLSDSTKNISKYYIDSSFFALTSKSEGFGMVILEALSFGLPIISFDCPSGPRDMINDNNGFLIQPGDEVLYQNTLVKLIKHEKLRKSLTLGALEFAANWNDDNITEHWRDVYK